MAEHTIDGFLIFKDRDILNAFVDDGRLTALELGDRLHVSKQQIVAVYEGISETEEAILEGIVKAHDGVMRSATQFEPAHPLLPEVNLASAEKLVERMSRINDPTQDLKNVEDIAGVLNPSTRIKFLERTQERLEGNGE